MALDARSRSSIYEKLVPLLGADDANVLMSEFPSVEAGELVTKQFLRAELAELRSELRAEIGQVRSDLSAEIGEVRAGTLSLQAEMADRFRQQTVWLGGGLAGATALIIGVIPLLS